MMLNRYQGNSGRVVRVEDGSYSERPLQRGSPRPGASAGAAAPARAKPQSVQHSAGAENPLGGLSEKLSKLLPGTLGGLETEDLILLLILYLMYRESGDSELLIIMGAMFLL